MSRPYHAPEFLHPTNWTINESRQFLRNRDPNKPFFLKTSFARPHSPYDAPAFYYDIYEKKEIPQPHIGEWSTMHDVKKDSAKPDAWRGQRSNEEIRRARIGYYGNIHHIDLQIGAIAQLLGYWGESEESSQTIEIAGNGGIIRYDSTKARSITVKQRFASDLTAPEPLASVDRCRTMQFFHRCDCTFSIGMFFRGLPGRYACDSGFGLDGRKIYPNTPTHPISIRFTKSTMASLIKRRSREQRISGRANNGAVRLTLIRTCFGKLSYPSVDTH
ncbi:sulfatase-like hydrolase/transferase [Paenibacillus sp. UNC451MF]|uniref:sulfatase-like hydrolase/transferase n=1 Tax=Paenibacillus sp. UNC451MF TaxID=1449063 RepID=UPI00055A14C0|nr:sulfatase-like hydrolase/transferase [Paenibacillus sp. UNC451MF]